ncbi:MAG: nitroreductase family protein [Kiritimatiellia bacterium]|nr:nitroreductase family protein [Kiritimatiellia bacterium]MDP6630306.1 nitroreductase family protein [Kiritimatiellia bacterium]MDP6810813.1 nitroreductase family protein [Kiritimatiellia bacterium]MDP7024155.1 nitroreductase family protein [Kiritimatiellia bacterium]
MAVMEQIRKRYSVRKYEDRAVESEKLAAVLEAARLAPSARNVQEWRFVVVQDAAMRAELVEAANGQKFVGAAPVVIVCCAVDTNYVMRCGQCAHPIDLAIAIEHMALQAVEEGLGTCWIGSFFPDKIRALLNIPDDIMVVELLTLGYPADTAPDKKRVPLSDIVSHETWGF